MDLATLQALTIFYGGQALLHYLRVDARSSDGLDVLTFAALT